MQNNTPPTLSPASGSTRIENLLVQLNGEIATVLNENRHSQHIIDTDLAVYKNAFTVAQQERAAWNASTAARNEEMRELEEQVYCLNDQLNQLKGYRISVIVDGDGSIFAENLISRGREGGQTAAHSMFDSLRRYLSESFGQNPYQIWISIFFNKKGLMDALGRSSLSHLKYKLEDFVVGFNQANTRIIMLDVGYGKEEADSKVKEFLDRDISLPQTFKVFFAGCHDNGYASTLRSHITAGLGGKLILLKSYTDMASGISVLELPSTTIPGLFMEDKISDHAETGSPPTKSLPTVAQNDLDTFGPPPGLPAPSRPPATNGAAASYSGIVQKPVDRRMSISSYARSSPPPPTRRLKRGVPLSKQDPPPCNIHFLTGMCRFGEECTYGHDYELNDDHMKEMRQSAKRGPCPFLNKGESCPWDDDCIYGHTCPSAPTCRYLKLGKCKFQGADMHAGVN